MCVPPAFNCKFSNEGCERDAECCSFKCVQSHPGTNARCTRCSLHERCLYTHHCEERLVCGTNHTCCAKYWGTCTRREDCCNPHSFCREMDGFFYKRCIEGPEKSAAEAFGLGSRTLLVAGVTLALGLCDVVS